MVQTDERRPAKDGTQEAKAREEKAAVPPQITGYPLPREEPETAQSLDERVKHVLDYMMDEGGAQQDATPYESLSAFLAEDNSNEPDMWLVPGYVVRGGLALLMGPEKSMKSIIAATVSIAATVPGSTLVWILGKAVSYWTHDRKRRDS